MCYEYWFDSALSHYTDESPDPQTSQRRGVVITNSLRLHTNHVICPSCFDINLDCIFRVHYRNLIRHEGSADLLKGK